MDDTPVSLSPCHPVTVSRNHGGTFMSQLVDTSLGTQLEKLPPSSIEAEACLLASMMLEKELIGQIIPLIERDAFFQADHQIIFDVLLKLYEQNRPIDVV